jgi:predicted methyltransferase
MKTLIALITIMPLAFAAGLSHAAWHKPDRLAKVIQGPQRSVKHKLRDQYRHPHATLKFFGLKPDMTVVELEPGGGWYTEILAPYLKPHGHLIDAAPPLDSKSKFMRRMAQSFKKKLKADPDVYGNVKTVPFAPPKQTKLGSANSADMVLTFRNAHDWKMAGALKSVLKAAYSVLKPGGIFGIVSHRANPGTDPAVTAKKIHRLPEAYVINLAQQVGFKLEAVSRINANPRDPRTINIHMLPPSRAVAHGVQPAFNKMIDSSGAKHGKEMKAFVDELQPVFDHIGESDRMTLKFVKPNSNR